jgi:hypothetical protein
MSGRAGSDRVIAAMEHGPGDILALTNTQHCSVASATMSSQTPSGIGKPGAAVLSGSREDVWLKPKPAGQLERSSDGSSGWRRTGSKGVRSVLRATPSAISSARASPVAGALSMPQTLWRVAVAPRLRLQERRAVLAVCRTSEAC